MIDEVAPFVVAGLATGSVYALAAMGLVLTYKTSGVFNFAHGALAAVGAYVMWELWEVEGWPWPVAAAAAVLVAGVLGGVLLERLALGLGDKPTAMRVVATVGLLISLQGILVIRYGSATIPMRYFLPTRTVRILDVNVRYEQLLVFALAAAAAVGLTAFFRRSRLGIAMQGVGDDPALLGLQGTSPVQVRRRAWMVGSCFAAVSGALLAPSLGLDATLLTLLVVQAFGAAAIGRFSSLPLAYVGGLAVGVGQELLKWVVTKDVLTDHFSTTILQAVPSNLPFIVLFAVLLVTPKAHLVERGLQVVRRTGPPAPVPPRVLAVFVAALVVGLLVVPHVAGTRLPAYTSALCFAVILASLHLLVRTSGQVSLCQMAFAAVGASTVVHLRDAGLPFGLAVVGAGLVAVPVGAFIAVPAIRLSGVYLAIATFGFGLLMERIVFTTSAMFGQAGQIESARPAGFTSDEAYYHVVLLAAAACAVLLLLVRRSRLGRLLRALSDSPTAVVSHGTDTTVVRTLAFCLSAFTAAVGGSLLGPITGTATSGTFGFGVSLTLLAVLLIFGRRPLVAAVGGAAAYVAVPSHIAEAEVLEWLPVVFGVAAMLVATGVVGLLWGRWLAGARARERLGVPSRVQARLATVAPAAAPGKGT